MYGGMGVEESKKLLNCICEVNIDGKMALVSLYDDLPHFEYDQTIDNLKDSNTKLKISIQELKEHIKQLEKVNLHLKSVNATLSKNITSLYKTASSEIQRKDKIIDELRKSEVDTIEDTSKMFSTTDSLQLKENRSNQLSNGKQDSEQMNNIIENSKVSNQNNDSFTNIVMKPNHDIPKTIYYKRMCQKLIGQQNENINFNHNMPIQIDNNYNDDNVLKGMETHINHESKQNINSTLIIVESDTTLSDRELDTTPVIECKNPEKVQDIVSLQSFSSTQPVKLKKKMVITPATIGVQNMSNKTTQCVSKLKRISNVDPKTQSKIKNSLENKNNQSIFNKECCTIDELTPEKEQFPSTDIVRKQNSFTSDKIPSINNEIKQVPDIQTTGVIEKENNNLSLTKVKKSTCVTRINPLIDNELNKSTKNIKCLSINNEKELSSPSKQKGYQPNVSVKSYFKNITADEISKPSIHIEVEQVPNKRKTAVVIDKSTLPLMTVKKYSHVTCKYPLINNELNISTKNVKSLSNNEKEASKQQNSQSECKLPINKDINNLTQPNDSVKCSFKSTFETSLVDKTDKPSINIEVEQIPFRRKKIVIEKNNTLVQTEIKKSSQIIHINPLIDNQLNVSMKNVKCFPINNKKESSNSSKSKHKNNQSECNSPIEPVVVIPKYNQSNDYFNSSSKNTTIEKNVGLSSINIEVEQGSIFRRSEARRVILHTDSENSKKETKKGRRIQLITIKNHYSQPLPSFNGAKKTEIDVSQKSIHIEKVVESSSLFYIPQVKRRRTMNFGNADS